MPLDLHPSFLSVITNPGGLQRPECRESRLGHTFFVDDWPRLSARKCVPELSLSPTQFSFSFGFFSFFNP
ncbi:uncharacterized protein B0T23DRAFT_67794 [Neurospora hispaniola]|uniref:Uncharacterized protein n=1 Tax=Neurospora hispaniola TaxID=588809 RepID=A0AAJ0MTC5_9PEZI|nr:hypothetical protein B0T23DRAFT_67794 [Neurospora hispaniola]